MVTNSQLCDFGTNFTLVFTPDVKYYTSTLQAYKLSDSNPGQFFYNVFQTGGTGTVTLTLPYPFVTQGATPIHVYNSLTAYTSNGQTCLQPTGEINNYQTQVTLATQAQKSADKDSIARELSRLLAERSNLEKSDAPAATKLGCANRTGLSWVNSCSQ